MPDCLHCFFSFAAINTAGSQASDFIYRGPNQCGLNGPTPLQHKEVMILQKKNLKKKDCAL